MTASDLSLAWTAGGVVSTAADLIRFHESIFRNEPGAPLLGDVELARTSAWGRV